MVVADLACQLDSLVSGSFVSGPARKGEVRVTSRNFVSRGNLSNACGYWLLGVDSIIVCGGWKLTSFGGSFPSPR